MNIQEKKLIMPDVRDGLNAVERSLLCAMYRLKLVARSRYIEAKKVIANAEIVNTENMMSVSETLNRMTEYLSKRHPLTYSGDAFDSELVTNEAQQSNRKKWVRPSLVAKFMFDGVKFDEDPSALPCCFPNLLVNGVYDENGYIVMPHNMHEITAAVHAICEKPEITDEELFEIVPGPDFSIDSTIGKTDALLEIQKGCAGKIILSAHGKNREIWVNGNVLVPTESQDALIEKRLSLKEMLVEWIDFRDECIRRKAEEELKNERNKLHLLDGVVSAMDNIESNLAMVRSCASADEMIRKSVEFGLDEKQAEYMVHYSINKICHYDKRTIYGKCKGIIANLENLVANKDARKQRMLKTLDMIDRKFGDERYTRIV